MKLGAENRTQLWVLAVLTVLAIAGFWHWSASKTASTPAATTLATNPKAAAAAAAVHARNKELALDPTLHLELLKDEQKDFPAGKRNIFSAAAAEPEPEKKPCSGAGCKGGQQQATVTPPPQQTGPPPPPAINLKFYGFASRPGEAKKIFLADGEDVFIGSEGDMVERRYRIVKIGPSSVEIEDVLNNNRQTIPLTQG